MSFQQNYPAMGPGMEGEELAATLKHYVELLKRRLWIILSVFVTSILFALAYNYRQIPVYEAMSTVIIEQEIVQTNDIFGAMYSYKAFFFKTQCDIIRSDTVMQKALQMQGLPDGKDDVAALKARVSVDPVEDTYLARIKVQHTDFEQTAKHANAVARAFIEHTREDKRSASRDSYSWLSEQLAILKARVKQSETELLKFKEKENIVSLEKRQSLIEENLSLTHKRYMEANLKTLELETVIREIRKISDKPEMMESLPRILENATVNTLKEEYHRLNIELAKLSKKFKSKHPKIIRLKSQIANARSRLKKEIDKLLTGIDIEYRIAQTNQDAIKENLDTLKRQSMELARQAIQHGVLKRESESNMQMYSALLGSLKKVDVTASMTPNNIRIVDLAKIPRVPISPNKRKNISLGIFFGLAIGIGLALLVEYVDDTIKDENDVELHLRNELLGQVLREKKDTEITIDNIPENLIQAYRSIKTVLRFYKQDHMLKTMLITSTVAGEGKTVSTMIVGHLMAETGLRVLIVDFDFFRPRLKKLFRISDDIGAIDYFLHGKKIEQVIHETKNPNLHIIPTGLLPSNPREIFESEKLKEMLDELKNRYDLVIFDTPPLSVIIELSFLCSLVDGIALVVKAKSTSRHLIKKTMKILNASRANIIGYILTHVSRGRDASYYYYNYYDYRGRGKK
jgi:succinoglycan biosynthesis transport protein ExoP